MVTSGEGDDGAGGIAGYRMRGRNDQPGRSPYSRPTSRDQPWPRGTKSCAGCRRSGSVNAASNIDPTLGSRAVPSPRRHSDLEEAWNELHDAKPARWFVGRPSWDDRRKVWDQHAFDPRERAHVGHRSREWTAVASTELGVIRELARCLRLIREGRVPE